MNQEQQATLEKHSARVVAILNEQKAGKVPDQNRRCNYRDVTLAEYELTQTVLEIQGRVKSLREAADSEMANAKRISEFISKDIAEAKQLCLFGTL